jgi:PPP family 3-phenylpropionic acid transporter
LIAGIPYWRLSSFYFFYFALVGALSPFFSLYLHDIGLTAQAIGSVNAVILGTKIIAPNLWGWLCDRTGKRLRIISIGSFFALMCFGGLFYWKTLLPILFVTFIYSFFWNAVLSQFETVTIQYLKKDSHRYSQVRLWGSVGFIATVIILGWLFDSVSIEYLIPIAWVLLLLVWLSTLTLNEPPIDVRERAEIHWLIILKKPAIICFFIATFLLQFSFGAYYTFFSLHLESFNYSRTSIGLLWALGVFCEVILFAFIHRFMTKKNVLKIFFWSLLLTGFRWLVIAFFTDSVALMILVQTIHALSFGACHAACIELIRQFFRDSNIGQGQALYSALTFGFGGAIGAMSGGFLWDISSQLLFSVSAVAVFIAAAIVWFGLCRADIDA